MRFNRMPDQKIWEKEKVVEKKLFNSAIHAINSCAENWIDFKKNWLLNFYCKTELSLGIAFVLLKISQSTT